MTTHSLVIVFPILPQQGGPSQGSYALTFNLWLWPSGSEFSFDNTGCLIQIQVLVPLTLGFILYFPESKSAYFLCCCQDFPNYRELRGRKTSTLEKRVPEKHLFLLYWLCQSLWLCGSQQTVENSSRDRDTRPPDLPPEKSVCRSSSNS